MKYWVIFYRDGKGFYSFATYAKSKAGAIRNFIADIGSGYKITEIEESNETYL